MNTLKKLYLLLLILVISSSGLLVKSSPLPVDAIKIGAVTIAAFALYSMHQAYIKNQIDNRAVQQENKPLMQKLNNSLLLSTSTLALSTTTYGICTAVTGRFAS